MPDVYANQGLVSLSPTLNTLSFAELATFVSVFEKKAFIISRIEYVFSEAAILEFNAETDVVDFGMSTANTFATASIGQASIFDFNTIIANLMAAGVSSALTVMPFIKDLSTLPGGGALIPSRPVFLWMKSTGWVAAGSISARLYFIVKDLKADEYWELVESTRLVGA